jgi:hypothetical protein
VGEERLDLLALAFRFEVLRRLRNCASYVSPMDKDEFNIRLEHKNSDTSGPLGARRFTLPVHRATHLVAFPCRAATI